MTRRIEYIPLSDIKSAPRNPKKHSPDISGAIDRFGYADAVILDERTGRLVAGHGRKAALEGMKAKGESPPDGVEDRDGDWLVPVQRGWSSRSDAEADAFLVAHNKLTEAGGWDDTELGKLLAGLGDDAAGLGVDDKELSSLLELADPVPEGEDDGGGEPPEDPVSKRGDVYALGPHRLMCGDSTSAEDVGALLGPDSLDFVWADPPYGMRLDTDYTKMGEDTVRPGAKKKWAPVIGDGEEFDPAPTMRLWGAPEAVWWGADYYRAHLPPGGSWYVWDKRANDYGADLDKVQGNVFELAWTNVLHRREIARVTWSGSFGMLEKDARTNGDGKRVHPTQKPVKLTEWVFDRIPGTTVGDPYSGSGGCFIACAKTGRKCYGMEISPAYCDVIRKRWGDWARSADVDPGPDAL